MTTGSSFVFGLARIAREHLQAVETRQLQIEQHQLRQPAVAAPGVRARREQIIERLDAVAGDDDLVRDLALAERAQRQLHVVRVVLDQQDLVHRAPRASARA